MEEKSFIITEAELNKIFEYIISRPLKETIEHYAVCIEVGKRVNITEDKDIEEKIDEQETTQA